jgi:hypothetical protein
MVTLGAKSKWKRGGPLFHPNHLESLVTTKAPQRNSIPERAIYIPSRCDDEFHVVAEQVAYDVGNFFWL